MKLSAKAFQKALQEAEMDAAIHRDPNEEIPFEHLVVPLGADSSGEEMFMQIGLIDKPLEEESDEDQALEPLNLQFIQFLVMLPVKIKDESLGDTQAFINLLNALIELPGFGILESESLPFYRYTLVCNQHQVDEKLFVMTVGLILYILDHYLPTLEDIATGQKRFAEVVEAARAAGEEA